MNDFTGVSLIVWDLDGTLLDSFGIYAQVVVEAAQLSGLSVPSELTMRHNFHGSLDESIKGAFDMVDDDTFAILLNDFLKIQENYYGEPESHLFTDAVGLIERFNTLGMKQIIVTNREHAGRGSASPRYIVEHSSLKNYITDIVCGEDAGARKPSAEVMAFVPSAQELTGANMVIIGDQHVDAQLAINLGAQAIIVNRGDQPIPHMDTLSPDADQLRIVSSLKDIAVG